MFPVWNQEDIYMFLLENTFIIWLLRDCQPATLPGNFEFRKPRIPTKLDQQDILTL